MSAPINMQLYQKVKELANKRFKSKTGVYKSSWIVREYKRRGGRYRGSVPRATSGLKRWYKERWVDLNRPIKNSKGKVIGYESCGRPSPGNRSSRYPLCRPSNRVNSKTPRTYKQLTKNSIQKAKTDKARVRGMANIKFGGKQQYFTGGGKQQYHGKKSTVMVNVPQNVRKWAKYAFKLKALGFRGALETGWKRAKQLANKTSIPIQDVRYMRNWFARHVYTSYPGFKKWTKAGRPKDKSWHNKHAIIAWVTWAGDAGFRWVNSQRVINLLNTHFNKSYKPIKGKRK